jgi:hypothetical protein
VREEQREVERLFLKFLEQRLAQPAQTGAGVEDDDVVAVAKFDAGGVAAVADGGCPRRRDGAAHTPECYDSARFDGNTLAQAVKEGNGKSRGPNNLSGRGSKTKGPVPPAVALGGGPVLPCPNEEWWVGRDSNPRPMP